MECLSERQHVDLVEALGKIQIGSSGEPETKAPQGGFASFSRKTAARSTEAGRRRQVRIAPR
jgi:hypothetical protein